MSGIETLLTTVCIITALFAAGKLAAAALCFFERNQAQLLWLISTWEAEAMSRIRTAVWLLVISLTTGYMGFIK